jgi:hypothetical protein
VPPSPPSATAGPDGLTAEEEATLASLQEKVARAAAGEGAVELRITPESGHSSMHYGGITLTQDGWTAVPASRAGDLATAADNAGVTITQKEG